MAGGVLIVDVIAVHSYAIARLPVSNSGANAKHYSRSIRTHYMERLIVARSPCTLFAETLQKTKG